MIEMTLKLSIVWLLISIGIAVFTISVVDDMTGYMMLEAWQYITIAFVIAVCTMLIGYCIVKVATKGHNESTSHPTSKELQE